MTTQDILQLRLQKQHIEGSKLARAADVVRWLGAVQSQDYTGAKWAIAQRTHSAIGADIDQALAEGKILRTHVLRPTWHFVAPEDIRWLLALTAPRIKKLTAYYDHKVGLDETLFKKTNNIITSVLHGGNQLTRAELGEALQAGGVDIKTGSLLRLTYIVGRAELDALICSGGLRGKQHTYALLDERAPAGQDIPRDAALAELARRYFVSHGPGTLKDFSWWSGLAVRDAAAGLQAVQKELASENVDGQTYWYEAPHANTAAVSNVHLLPNYDEYVVAYTDRSLFFDHAAHLSKLDARANPLFNNVIVAEGHIVGTWKRAGKDREATVVPTLFTPLNQPKKQALLHAAERYNACMND